MTTTKSETGLVLVFPDREVWIYVEEMGDLVPDIWFSQWMVRNPLLISEIVEVRFCA